MMKFASRSTTLQLALATAVLLPMSAFAEPPTTARQMLAHAQTQALNVPGDFKKTAPELDKSEKIMSGPVVTPPDVAFAAAPLPIIEPPAPISPPMATSQTLAAPVAPAETIPARGRVDVGGPVAPAADAVKASSATVAMLPATSSTTETHASAPATPPVTAIAAPSVAPVVAPAVTPAQPSMPATAATEPTRLPPAANVSSSEKAAQAQRQPSTASPAMPTRPARRSAARSSARSDEVAIGTRISQIMRRPEVQSLMSQYGLE
ncbi:hypothetical protein LQG66_03100 [Bradyrhizobium ontarionense]|uniref:Uncharacterized protein n=1 Tax=Bradyrhizobium ontarionense TaxID=2898149 RepID=A0ABY3RDF5_9BRAD|nr:hypothetical protein [Bradyrhizobium sp. A19]UFZ05323.1 hypothetical protein LQG66_03100 [Bradyrhizobium sp. A19]